MREAPCPGRCATPGAAGSRATGPLPAAWVSARPSVRGRSGGHTGSFSLATRMLFQGPAVAGDGVQAGRCLYLALPATCAPSRLPPAGVSRDDPAVLVQGQAQWHGVLAPGRASSAVTSEAAAEAWSCPRSLRELGEGGDCRGAAVDTAGPRTAGADAPAAPSATRPTTARSRSWEPRGERDPAPWRGPPGAGAHRGSARRGVKDARTGAKRVPGAGHQPASHACTAASESPPGPACRVCDRRHEAARARMVRGQIRRLCVAAPTAVRSGVPGAPQVRHVSAGDTGDQRGAGSGPAEAGHPRAGAPRSASSPRRPERVGGQRPGAGPSAQDGPRREESGRREVAASPGRPRTPAHPEARWAGAARAESLRKPRGGGPPAGCLPLRSPRPEAAPMTPSAERAPLCARRGSVLAAWVGAALATALPAGPCSHGGTSPHSHSCPQPRGCCPGTWGRGWGRRPQPNSWRCALPSPLGGRLPCPTGLCS